MSSDTSSCKIYSAWIANKFWCLRWFDKVCWTSLLTFVWNEQMFKRRSSNPCMVHFALLIASIDDKHLLSSWPWKWKTSCSQSDEIFIYLLFQNLLNVLNEISSLQPGEKITLHLKKSRTVPWLLSQQIVGYYNKLMQLLMQTVPFPIEIASLAR